MKGDAAIILLLLIGLIGAFVYLNNENMKIDVSNSNSDQNSANSGTNDQNQENQHNTNTGDQDNQDQNTQTGTNDQSSQDTNNQNTGDQDNQNTNDQNSQNTGEQDQNNQNTDNSGNEEEFYQPINKDPLVTEVEKYPGAILYKQFETEVSEIDYYFIKDETPYNVYFFYTNHLPENYDCTDEQNQGVYTFECTYNADTITIEIKDAEHANGVECKVMKIHDTAATEYQ